jgi:hypothetical protein
MVTNTSSFCGYVLQSRDVIFGHFAGVNEDRLLFLYVPNERNFCSFSSICGHVPLENAIQLDYLSSLESLHMHIVQGFMPDRCK